MELVERVRLAVAAVPPGRVASYGDVAELVGCHPRRVGRILATDAADLPWWRITNSSGRLPSHLLTEAQRHWRAEGIGHDPERGTVAIARHRVDPESWLASLASVTDESCLDWDMSDDVKVVSATSDIAAPADTIFELIADPSRQPEWDGNDNLARAEPGQRVHAVGDVFVMQITKGQARENHVVEFEEGRLIAWRPSPVGEPCPGQLWRWELTPVTETTTRVTHTYDWTGLTDESRMDRARGTTADNLQASIDRLDALVTREPA